MGSIKKEDPKQKDPIFASNMVRKGTLRRRKRVMKGEGIFSGLAKLLPFLFKTARASAPALKQAALEATKKAAPKLAKKAVLGGVSGAAGFGIKNGLDVIDKRKNQRCLRQRQRRR